MYEPPSVKNAALTLSGMTSHPDVNLKAYASAADPVRKQQEEE